jgi:tyrosyl-tRNA synthetase
VPSRSISEGYLQKTAQAADQWALWARDILDGKRKSMLTVLEERGYVNQIAG